jgi:glucose-6-phosphate 1-dehydrogenase
VWGNDPIGSSRRARYIAGRVGDRMVPSYVDEKGVDPARFTGAG